MGKIASQPLANIQEQGRRWSRRFEGHVKSLNEVAESTEIHTGRPVPMFDPESGGSNSKIMLLFESPGKATIHTRFISLDNPDMSAVSARELCERAELHRDEIVCWNIVCWFCGIDPDSKDRRLVSEDEIRRGAHHLVDRVLPLMPEVRSIVAMGSPPAKGLELLRESRKLPSSVVTFATHNTSMRALNPERSRRDEVVAVLQQAARV